MPEDPYAGAAAAWADDVALVYGPLAAALVRRHPGPLAGRMILDAGAGTGLVSAELARAGARPLAADLSPDMLRWEAASRPPAVVADVTRLPLAATSVDGAVAAFVLNHLPQPRAGLAELARVTRPGGAVLASVYASVADNGVRDVVDGVATRHGFEAPAWHRELRAHRAPQVGTAAAVGSAAAGAGLDVLDVVEEAVDVGVRTAEDLVRYRFGQAQYTPWFAAMPPERAAAVRADAVAAARPVMTPYRPLVLLLVARAR
jgi:demethylmenaquinone methyltransferase/2-methoxy-6-polyprenyl-1,4-benzoquinol methylase